jgi:hypothetical protein
VLMSPTPGLDPGNVPPDGGLIKMVTRQPEGPHLPSDQRAILKIP